MHGTSGGANVPLSSYGGLVTLSGPETVPEGASPRTYDTDFLVGSVKTRAGLTSVYNTVDAEVGPNPGTNIAAFATWANPGAILLNGATYATVVPGIPGNFINIEGFNFNIPATSTVTGVLLTVSGYANAPANLQAQLIVNGSPIGEIKTEAISASQASWTYGTIVDSWGLFLGPDVNSLNFGVQLQAIPNGFDKATVFLNYVTLIIGISTGSENFQFITTFVAQDESVKNISLDAAGNLFVEDVTNNPGVLTLVLDGITPNSSAVGVNGPDVEYLAFTNGFTGSDMPLQYTKKWIDRITQVGPAVAPTFTPISASSVDFAINNITQPAAMTWTSSYFLQSAGPGSNTPGNVVTFYYSDSTVGGPDADLVAAFNSDFPVYLYASFTGTPTTFGPQVVLVTAIGEAQPPGQPRNFYYFTFQVNSIAYTYYQGSGHPGYTASYQRTLATMTMDEPVPNVTIGTLVTVSGNSVSNWNANWTISETPNASSMVITGSSVTNGVATLNYSVTNGTANPAAGELITITNTLNANGALNVTEWPITAVSGGSTGTITLDGFPGTLNASFATENGLATTAGTIFNFDPGAALVGTGTNPIYGTGTGGNLVFNPTGLFIDPGTYQGTVFFITRNGYYTCPAPPVTFTVPNNTLQLQVSNILLGPPNVVARGIAITEAGQNGVPGANFFTLPTPVVFYESNVKYTATSFFVNDNMSTSTTLFFTGTQLDDGLAIDVYGYNLFNQIEIGDPGWLCSYSGRNFYGLCVNKVQNFINLSFDGGYLPAQLPLPAGWTTPNAFGSLNVSAKFGNSYLINNTSGASQPQIGLITQTAYQDAYQEPILEPNTLYSVRVTARIPSGGVTGTLSITLTAAGVTVGSYSLPFIDMTTSFAIYEGTLLATPLVVVPSTLQLNVSALNVGIGDNVEIDRIEIIPTAIPILTTTIFGSYAGLPEQVDAITGEVGFSSENQQPIVGAMVMYDTLYGLKGWGGKAPGSSLYSLQESANLEPAQWQEPEVAQRSGGAIGPLAYDLGEQWFLGASRPGLYLFEGGQPGKIMQEIYQVWDAINWTYGYTIWVKVDITHRRIFVGVPLPTPNFWLPNAPVNANPTTPNVILMCNYQGLDSGQMLKSEPQMHVTMFGALNAIDMRRKWSIWQIPSPYAALCQGPTDEEIYICNGRGNSQVYELDPASSTDQGLFIDALYTTAGLVEQTKRQQVQGIGNFRIRWAFLVAALQSAGLVNLRFIPNRLLYPEPTSGYSTWTVPGGFSPGNPALNDVQCSLNFAATRAYLEFRENDGQGFSLSNLVLRGRADVWNPITGSKGGATP